MFPELALWLVPLLVALASRRMAPLHIWRNTGIGFGLVVAPASLGLYGLYFVGPIAALFGMLGLVLELVHGPPGYNLAIALGLVPSHTVIEGAARVPVELLNAMVWSLAYGTLGWFVDVWRKRQRAVRPNAA